MLPKNSSEELANLFKECRATQTNSRQFTSLENGFQPKIQKLSSKYPPYWKDDFIQEGRLGLLKAVQNFPTTSHYSEFENYALAIISNKMIDFYRRAIGKSMIEITQFDDDGNPIKWKESLFINQPLYVSEEYESFEYVYNIPTHRDYVISLTLSIDFKYFFKNENLKNHFSDREIKVFELHFYKGYNVSEVACKINLSVSQASKIISKTKTKAQQLLAYAS